MPLLGCAVRAAIHRAAGFEAVPDDRAAAVLAAWRDRVDRALERVVCVSLAARDGDPHRLVVVVTAYFADRHWGPPSGLPAGDRVLYLLLVHRRAAGGTEVLRLLANLIGRAALRPVVPDLSPPRCEEGLPRLDVRER